jgi:HK97 family phage prohead protease
VIHQRTFTTDLHLRADSDRQIAGTLVPYGVQATVTEDGVTYVEDFAPGALAGDVARAGEVGLFALHPRSGDVLPIGRTVEFTDSAAGFDGAWHISDTEFGNDVLTLVRDRALRCLSAGFSEGTNRWHNRSRVTRVTARLDHASLVGRGAYSDARLRAEVAAARPDPLLLLARLRSR